MSRYYIGLLSGTSMDAVDAAIVDFHSHPPRLLACHAEPIPDALRNQTRQLCFSGDNEIYHLGQLDILWGKLFAKAINQLLNIANIDKKDIIAIGSHGQTIRHSPLTSPSFTLQIGDPNTIAALTDIMTIADFRRMDIACGGQGAPLAPAFHRYLFQQPEQDTFVINIGGIANVSYVPFDLTKPLIGFDTGPGNTLIDACSRKYINKPFDENGEWARSGQIDHNLLQHLLNDPYFSKKPPKSTGPEYFHLDWVNSTIEPANMQRTLLELSAKTITDHIIALADTELSNVLLCGGGARNIALMERIQALLGPNFSVSTTHSQGISSDWLEAMLFAWLAKMRVENQKIDLKTITGSHKPVLLGGIYQ